MGFKSRQTPRITWAAPFLMVVLLVLGCARGGDETAPLTDEERQQVTELILSVAEDPEETLKPAHDEIWSILRRHGSPSRKLLDRLKTEFLTIGEGHHLFWLDAREALKTHRVVKSRSRAEWEERLAKNGWLSPQQRDRFDDLMKQVAKEEAIEANHGVEISLSPAMVDEIANSWDEQEFEQAIAILLTPPKSSKRIIPPISFPFQTVSGNGSAFDARHS